MGKFKEILENIYDLIVTYGLKFILAIVVLLAGLWVIKILTRSLRKFMTRKEVDPSLVPFLANMFSAILKVLLVISVMGMVGIQMTSFIAVLGAAGLAVGLALQGTLQNFAGGVMILLFKPYRVGDFIEAQGHAGSVKEIQIFQTIITTPDNSTVIIPNSPLATGVIKNYTTQPKRRIDFSFGIGYGDDIDKARKVLLDLADADNRVLKEDNPPMVAVEALADSSVNMMLRTWVKSEDYWDLFFDMTEKVKKAFDKNGISIPFPQTDVHLFNQK
ncbi:MAG: mechanosensitive ion channel [Bacteroidales bacterium]|nr:mechanosensitive ion channel [Bacteroidales bacterium]MBN2698830.1 mechanosensitive ion channel [Bacteroidales bacterium]